MFGNMVGRSSGARGLIPRSRGGRIAMGAGVGIAAGGGLVLGMKNRANNNSGRGMSVPTSTRSLVKTVGDALAEPPNAVLGARSTSMSSSLPEYNLGG
jgi:hypothetical protein